MRCVSHADSKATRQCTSCQRAFCGLCIKQVTHGERVLDVCALCKAPLGPVTQRFRPSPSLRDLVTRPLGWEGLITAAALSWLVAVAGWLPGIGSFIKFASGAALTAYYFQIIAHVGDGKPGLPGPSDAIDTVGEMWRQTARGWICLFAAALPFVIWFHLLHDGKTYQPATAFLLLAVGFAYLPAAIVCVVLTDSWVGALYPVAWLQVITRAPRSYARLWALFMLSLVAWQLISMAGALVAWIPFVGGFVVNVTLDLALFAQAALVGGFLMRHAEDFGYQQ